MKLPRDVSGAQLIRAVEALGYEVIRQKGSHVRLKHPGPPAHLITIPNHHAMKIGTLHAIISDVANARAISTESLIEML